MAKSGATLPLRQMIAYERCKKVGAILTPRPPPTLNKQSQEGQGMQGCIRKDHTTDAREAPNGCGE